MLLYKSGDNVMQFRVRCWLFIIILLIGSSVLSFPAKASNHKQDTSFLVASNQITIEELKTRRGAVESLADIDVKLKEECLKNIDQAIGYLKITKIAKEKYVEYEQLLKSAPARTKSLEATLKNSRGDKSQIETILQRWDFERLNLHFQKTETQLTEAKKLLSEWEDRLITEQAVSGRIADQIIAAVQRTKAILFEIEQMSDTPNDDFLVQTNLLSLYAEKEKLKAEITLNELRQSGHHHLLALFRNERDVASQAVAKYESALNLLSDAIQYQYPVER